MPQRYQRIRVQREIGPRTIVIAHIRKEHMTQVPKDDDMVKTFPPVQATAVPYDHSDMVNGARLAGHEAAG
jgi:hypothetical protein